MSHAWKMGRILKDFLYGELASGRRPTGRPQLRFKDACKRDLKQMNIDINTWEAAAADRSAWRCKVQKELQQFEDELKRQAEDNRFQRKFRPLSDAPASMFGYATFLQLHILVTDNTGLEL
ncbi:uncharacterized protein [Procambarus clarkii]|uniref:uncharacterized protein n=1 Tax=Procambarus clarkii TaxID=6728 RepID=UPI0037428F98